MARLRDTDAAYRSLARTLREAILRNDYADGTRLPTEAALAVRYQVGRQTVRRAFQDLVAVGMVVRVPGRGTFAAPKYRPYLRQLGAIDDLMALSPDSNLQLVTPLQRKIALDAASRLRLSSRRGLHRQLPAPAGCHPVASTPSICPRRSDGPSKASRS